MAKKKELTPEELEQQADALLAAADAAEEAGKQAEPKKKSAKRGAAPSEEEAPHIMTDEEAKKAGIVRLDDKQVAALPAASWLINQEKLRELLAKGKKKGKLESAELMEAVDDLNLESEQMDQLYDSLEARTSTSAPMKTCCRSCLTTSPPPRRSPTWRKRSW